MRYSIQHNNTTTTAPSLRGMGCHKTPKMSGAKRLLTRCRLCRKWTCWTSSEARKAVSKGMYRDLNIDDGEGLSTLVTWNSSSEITWCGNSFATWLFWDPMYHLLANSSTGCKAVDCGRKNGVSGQPNDVALRRFVSTNDCDLAVSKI